jgi:hypothetical protein
MKMKNIEIDLNMTDVNSSQNMYNKFEFGCQLLLVISATFVKYIICLTICFLR